jgi:hypothetical protein
MKTSLQRLQMRTFYLLKEPDDYSETIILPSLTSVNESSTKHGGREQHLVTRVAKNEERGGRQLLVLMQGIFLCWTLSCIVTGS